MFKLKSHSGGKKRFYITKNSKYIAKRPFKTHNLFKKSKIKKYFLDSRLKIKACNIKNLVYLS